MPRVQKQSRSWADKTLLLRLISWTLHCGWKQSLELRARNLQIKGELEHMTTHSCTDVLRGFHTYLIWSGSLNQIYNMWKFPGSWSATCPIWMWVNVWWWSVRPLSVSPRAAVAKDIATTIGVWLWSGWVMDPLSGKALDWSTNLR